MICSTTVRKSLKALLSPSIRWPCPGAAGLLVGRQGDVVPVVGHDGVEQFGLAAPGLIEAADELGDGYGHDHSWLFVVVATRSRTAMVSWSRNATTSA
jgi:hypothetical protein